MATILTAHLADLNDPKWGQDTVEPLKQLRIGQSGGHSRVVESAKISQEFRRLPGTHDVASRDP